MVNPLKLTFFIMHITTNSLQFKSGAFPWTRFCEVNMKANSGCGVVAVNANPQMEARHPLKEC